MSKQIIMKSHKKQVPEKPEQWVNARSQSKRNLYISPELHKKLKAYALELDITMLEALTQILEEHFRKIT